MLFRSYTYHKKDCVLRQMSERGKVYNIVKVRFCSNAILTNMDNYYVRKESHFSLKTFEFSCEHLEYSLAYSSSSINVDPFALIQEGIS